MSAELAAANKVLERATKSLAKKQKLLEARVTAQGILQGIAQEMQTQTLEVISSLVSKCLAAVFPEPYTFKITFNQKRGRTEPEFVLERNGTELTPMDAAGGGVVDIIVFALRVSALIMSKPQARRLLILDEPFKFVSQDLQSNILKLVDGLAADMDIQFIIVTHQTELIDEDSVRL